MEAKDIRMNTTLYQPSEAPVAIVGAEFCLNEVSGQVIQSSESAAEILGCAPFLVDVLANGNGYLIYSVFDSEGEANPAAMKVFSEITGILVDTEDEDDILRGPVLVITADLSY
ncbi:hypothetical protein I2I05_19100 [Hymenobacter sp. BT683]|uniref:PAS domain-containing protein n=1 Tax=Hymenobacter jeongseonensis TaxID=2791027 RepID=A0ABS0INB1_9BACT|nr:hypothetical protein [Hymenobacter jeongseonensis]MBF9239509.1 hypothetical protein [Hymenobacter jeongseonensis]